MRLLSLYLALRKRILLVLRGRYFVARRESGLFLIDIKNHIDRRIEAFGTYEKAQLDYFFVLGSRLQPVMFIDIGANVGLYSMQSARHFPLCEVLAFEPDLRNRAQLFANLFLNGLQDRVKVYDFALSDQAGFASFDRFSDENRGRSSIQSDGRFVVERRCLDDLIQGQSERIMIKMDVEGHELQVLRGGEELLFGNECLIQVESFLDEQELTCILAPLGYQKLNHIGHDRYYTNAHCLVRSP